MPDRGIDLGADLHFLWVVAKEDLPSVAAEYATANNHLDNTNTTMEAAFIQPEGFGLGDHGLVYGPWKALRDNLQDITADMAVHLDRVAAALRLAVSEFSEHDNQAKREFERLIDQDGEPPTVNVPAVRRPQ